MSGRKGDRVRWYMAMVAALALQGCGDVICIGPRPAIHVVVTDDVTGGKLSSAPNGTLTNGDDLETLDALYMDAWNAHLLWGGGMRFHGPYDIEVRAPGYHTWSRNGVEVGISPECGGAQQTTRFDVTMRRLVPSPGASPFPPGDQA